MLVHHMVTSWQCMLSVSIYTPGWRETKWSKLPCLRNQFDGRGLYPGPPDLEFKVLTVLSDTPPNWKRMHRNQAKKQSDGLAVLVLKTKSKWWKISHVMGRFKNTWVAHGGWVPRNLRNHQPLTQVARTPQKPALPATQLWALPATPSPSPSTHHTELRVQWRQKEQ